MCYVQEDNIFIFNKCMLMRHKCSYSSVTHIIVQLLINNRDVAPKSNVYTCALILSCQQPQNLYTQLNHGVASGKNTRQWLSKLTKIFIFKDDVKEDLKTQTRKHEI